MKHWQEPFREAFDQLGSWTVEKVLQWVESNVTNSGCSHEYKHYGYVENTLPHEEILKCKKCSKYRTVKMSSGHTYTHRYRA